MSKVIKVQWFESKNGDVLVGACRVLGSVHPAGDAWIATTNKPGETSRAVKVVFKQDAISLVEREVCVINVENV